MMNWLLQIHEGLGPRFVNYLQIDLHRFSEVWQDMAGKMLCYHKQYLIDWYGSAEKCGSEKCEA